MARRSTPPDPTPVPDPAPDRKHRRLGLYVPFAIAAMIAIAWTAVWIGIRGEAIRTIDADAAILRKAGYDVAWQDRRITGWPFRMDVAFTELRLREPTGWGFAAPKLEAEAFAYALDHWMIAAEDGFTFTRPRGGPVEVKGRVLRASLTDVRQTPPALSIEGLDVTFASGPGAQPFSLASAKRVELHLRPGPDDQGAILFKVEDGRTAPGSTLGAVGEGKPVSIIWDSILSKVSALKGADLAERSQAWSLAGGQFQVRQAGITAGDASLGAQAGKLALDSDGYLSGSLDITVRNGPQAMVDLARAGRVPPESALAAAAVMAARPDGHLPLTFQAGQTTLGAVALAPAPKLW
ncbi:DUF2125 domain-containing protein [Phenylobacterium aquaticum]|uniref:DUF2125 domain-containing protein n=1 Tax=Phenylobacterium aquaticum TaxID=1763816 RepID=UPI0026EF6206|nr:DUF2125 domain-containing protein [Phenylobacterium aquaticum]